MKLFSRTRAANNWATLQYQWFETRPGEIAGSDKAIMARADNDDVVGWHLFLECGD